MVQFFFWTCFFMVFALWSLLNHVPIESRGLTQKWNQITPAYLKSLSLLGHLVVDGIWWGSLRWNKISRCGYMTPMHSNYILFWLNIVKSLWTFFSYLKVSYLFTNCFFGRLDYAFLAYIYHNFLKFSDSEEAMKYTWKVQNLAIIWCDIKNISNKFSFRYNKIWAIESLLFRWPNKPTIRSMKSKVKNKHWKKKTPCLLVENGKRVKPESWLS